MPNPPDNARVTDLSAMAQQGRNSGFLSRVGQAVRYAIRGVSPDTWMSPNQPVQPAAPQTFGRQFDYPVGINLVYTPRSTELNSFAQLRALADNCDIVRLCIETRKDQMERQRWKIQHKDTEKAADDDPKAKAITQMFRRPDGDHSWNTWMRMVLEEVLVIDAASVLPRKKVNGEPAHFELIDGSTIKVLIDDSGRKPLPPSPAYQQVLKGMPAVDYSADELIYRPRNPRVHKFYGYSPVEQIVLTINIAIRRAMGQLQYFTEGNMPDTFLTVPPEWTPQQVGEFQKYWDGLMLGDQAQRRRVKFIPGGQGVKPHNVKDAPLKDDFDEWIARVACYAFSLSPTPFVKMMNRATADTAEEAALEEGLSPLKEWFKDLIDLIIEKYLGQGEYEFCWVDEKALDPEQQSKIHVAYLEKGAMTINEVRKQLGLESVAGGETAMIITRTGAVRVEDAAAPKPEPEVEPPKPTHEGDPPPNQQGEPPNPDQPPDPAKKKVAKAASSKPDPQPIDRNRPELLAAEERIRQAIQSGLDLSREDIVRQIAQAAPEGATPADVEGLVDRLQLEGLGQAHKDILDALTDAAKDGGHQAMTQLEIGSEDMTSLVNQKAVAYAEQRAAELITSDANGGELLDATRDMIRKTVEQAIAEGWSNARLSAELQDSYAFSKQRAEVIARTETAFADARGNLAAYVESGVKRKKWILDPDPCPVCVGNAEAGAIPLEQEFPGGVMAPPQHPNCRCDFVPILED